MKDEEPSNNLEKCEQQLADKIKECTELMVTKQELATKYSQTKTELIQETKRSKHWKTNSAYKEKRAASLELENSKLVEKNTILMSKLERFADRNDDLRAMVRYLESLYDSGLQKFIVFVFGVLVKIRRFSINTKKYILKQIKHLRDKYRKWRKSRS